VTALVYAVESARDETLLLEVDQIRSLSS